MNATIARFIANIQFGNLQRFRNMGVVSLFNSGSSGSGYSTRSKALAQIQCRVTHSNMLQGEAQGPTSYVQAFQPVPGQKGLLVMVNEEIVGLDIVSSERAYHALHARFVNGYAAGALLERPVDDGSEFFDKARNFFQQVAAGKEWQYPSIGGELDYYQLAGSAVSGLGTIVAGQVIHLSLFPTRPEASSIQSFAAEWSVPHWNPESRQLVSAVRAGDRYRTTAELQTTLESL